LCPKISFAANWEGESPRLGSIKCLE